MRPLRTIKDYEDQIERLRNEQYSLMLEKFPVGSIVEYYRRGKLQRMVVKYHAKKKCTLRVQAVDNPHSYVYWVAAYKCEPENTLEDRTIDCGYKKGGGRDDGRCDEVGVGDDS